LELVFSGKGEHALQTDVLILPVFKKWKSPLFITIDRSMGGLLVEIIKKKPSLYEGGTELVHVKGHAIKNVLLVGLGKTDELSSELLRKGGGRTVKALADYKMLRASLSVSDLIENQGDLFAFLEGFLLNSYVYNRYLGKPGKMYLRRLEILKKPADKDHKALSRLRTICDSVDLVRDLVNTPANDLTPAKLAGIAKGLSARNLKVSVFGLRDIKRFGMNAFHAVAKGSSEEPKFIVLEYRGGGKKKPIALAGKAITFDSGGLSIKPSDGMEKMKYDMAGGAAVIGAMKAVSELKISANIIGLVPACENLPGSRATKPGDVVKAITGKTVEIVNTDAEGRLILADAIGYSKKFAPKVIIDIATLTGACSVALGNEAIAMMGNDQAFMDLMKEASERSGERVWQMPLYDEFEEYIKSDIADVKNTGGRTGSLISAGYFLKEFAEDRPWLHLDIASTAWNEKEKAYLPKGASGIGVRLLVEFVRGGIQ